VNHRVRARALLTRVSRKVGPRTPFPTVLLSSLENQIVDAIRRAEQDSRVITRHDIARRLFDLAERVPQTDGQQLRRETFKAAAEVVLEMK
jgi:hypothetical protein